MDKRNVVISVLVGLLLVLGTLYFTKAPAPAETSFGSGSGYAHQQNESFLQGLTAGRTEQLSITNAGLLRVGASGTSMTQNVFGTCNLLYMDAAQSASSTKAYDCAVTGVVAGDVVVAQLNRATAFSPFLGWSIVASKASTTSGYITVIVENRAGDSIIPSVTGVGSSTQYIILR